MTTDWRLEHLQTQPYLRGVRVERRIYRAYSPEWDHDHCAACWKKFVEAGAPGDEVAHEGYATCSDYIHGAEYDWACIPCFQEFAEAMEWIAVTSPGTLTRE